MTSELAMRHTIDTDEDTFFPKILLSEDFNRYLYLENLKFPKWELTEMKEDDDKITRRVTVQPPTNDLPGPLRKALGDNALAYVEIGTFDKKSKRYSFKVQSNTMADKTNVSGELWLEKLGDKKITRCMKMRVEVKIFMIGKMVEERILEDSRQAYDKSESITNRYIKEKGL